MGLGTSICRLGFDVRVTFLTSNEVILLTSATKSQHKSRRSEKDTVLQTLCGEEKAPRSCEEMDLIVLCYKIALHESKLFMA